MSRKGKKPDFGIVVSHQSSTNKKLGYFLLLFPIVILYVIIFPENSEKLQQSQAHVFALLFVLLLSIWFAYMAYYSITLKKKLIIKNDVLIIESNKEKRNLRANLNNMVFWQKVEGEVSGILIKMPNFKFFLDSLEMDNNYGVERYLKGRFPKKEKKVKGLFG